MQESLERVTRWLVEASGMIEEDYFKLPVANLNEDNQGRENESKYRERVYTYELYHWWRCRWGRRFYYALNGENDKGGHPHTKPYIPDFLVHHPSEMHNLLIMEVKPYGPPITEKKYNNMLDDLKKLTYFRSQINAEHPEWNYYAAYFWIYGINQVEWDRFKIEFHQMIYERHKKEPGKIDLNLIQCYVHPGHRQAAFPVDW